jgi:hypothetical protein
MRPPRGVATIERGSRGVPRARALKEPVYACAQLFLWAVAPDWTGGRRSRLRRMTRRRGWSWYLSLYLRGGLLRTAVCRRRTLGATELTGVPALHRGQARQAPAVPGLLETGLELHRIPGGRCRAGTGRREPTRQPADIFPSCDVEAGCRLVLKPDEVRNRLGHHAPGWPSRRSGR